MISEGVICIYFCSACLQGLYRVFEIRPIMCLYQVKALVISESLLPSQIFIFMDGGQSYKQETGSKILAMYEG